MSKNNKKPQFLKVGTSPDTEESLYLYSCKTLKLMTWQQATSYAEKFNAQGFTDWRLPTEGELKLIFNPRSQLFGLRTKEANLNPDDYYWTGSEKGLNWTNAVAGHFYRGGHVCNAFPKTMKLSVLLVRSDGPFKDRWSPLTH